MNLNFSDNIFLFLEENKDTPFLDQDALNKVCGATYLQLNEKYNYITERDPSIGSGDYIYHNCGRPKPWKAYCGNVDNLYWEYLLKTPWKNDIVQYLIQIPNIEQIQKNGFQNLFDATGLPYTTLMKIILTSTLALTRKRIGDFRRNHLP